MSLNESDIGKIEEKLKSTDRAEEVDALRLIGYKATDSHYLLRLADLAKGKVISSLFLNKSFITSDLLSFLKEFRKIRSVRIDSCPISASLDVCELSKWFSELSASTKLRFDGDVDKAVKVTRYIMKAKCHVQISRFLSTQNRIITRGNLCSLKLETVRSGPTIKQESLLFRAIEYASSSLRTIELDYIGKYLMSEYKTQDILATSAIFTMNGLQPDDLKQIFNLNIASSVEHINVKSYTYVSSESFRRIASLLERSQMKSLFVGTGNPEFFYFKGYEVEVYPANTLIRRLHASIATASERYRRMS